MDKAPIYDHRKCDLVVVYFLKGLSSSNVQWPQSINAHSDGAAMFCFAKLVNDLHES